MSNWNDLRHVLAIACAAGLEIELEMIMANLTFNLSKRDTDIAIRTTNRPPETLVGQRYLANW